ncbi:MAG TPA: D-alanine--D-alanine ligase [Candidatus Avidesulfovibrio excrementigallinarum]|nr:D-alanine--D-alanine ligase [Candidatus Avidesulfovibrio excrementigallinarum]
MRVLLIAGGWSPERDISLMGAQSLLETLQSLGHSVTLFTLSERLDELLDAASKHDVAFLNLHGSPGEDGLVQAMLDRVGCPYQGADAAGSFLALHKAAAKAVLKRAGLRVPEGVFLTSMPEPGWEPGLPYPVFAKSNTGGSSLHMTKAGNAEELYKGLKDIFAAGCEAVIEPFIPGKELSCGVLGDIALEPVLIVPKSDYFDFHDKYAGEEGTEICPSPLPRNIVEQIREAALTAHRALGLRSYSRTDFILQDNGDLYALEVNTLPGMTNVSLLPKGAAAMGLSYPQLVQKLLELALRRGNQHA